MNLVFSSFPKTYQPNIQLKDFTTFQLGGKCLGMFNCETPEELQQALAFLQEHDLPYFMMGGGSNLVISDENLDCYVVRYFSRDRNLIKISCPEEVNDEGSNTKLISVPVSLWLDDLVLETIEQGLSGLEFCSGIPGTIGGAVVGNAGAFGRQIGDIINRVQIIDEHGKLSWLSQAECGFVYRHSRLKEQPNLKVVQVELNFTSEVSKEELLAKRAEILALRAEKHPNLSTHPCAGSFFRNVEPTSAAGRRQAAGWFLDEAGGKSLAVGGAKIFEKHANIIVKDENCTAQDVHDLSVKMQELVKQEFDLHLVREVRFVGNFQDEKVIDPHWIW